MTSEINFIPLGGQNELTNELYVLEINDSIFILDSGIERPMNANFGIKFYIPKIDYLVNNKQKIKGIFLSNALFSRIGSLEFIMKKIPNINIFGSQTTLETLPIYFGDKTKNWNMLALKTRNQFQFNDVSVTPFSISSSLPGSFGYSFGYKGQNIVYLNNFVFDSMYEYNIPIYSIFPNPKEKTFLLLADSINSGVDENNGGSFRIRKHIEQEIKFNNSKTIISLYDENILNLIEIIDLARDFQRPVFLDNKYNYELINFYIKKKIIANCKIKLIDEKTVIPKNAIVVFAKNHTTLFNEIIDLTLHGESGYNFSITKKDLFIFASPPVSGNEHLYAEALSSVMLLGCDILQLPVASYRGVHPTSFDLRNYLQILKPKYFIPIRGLYKEQIKFADVYASAGFARSNFLVAENGEKVAFKDFNYIGTSKSTKEFGKIIIESSVFDDVSSTIIDERQELGKNGIVTMGLIVSSKEKKIMSQPDVQMRGVVFLKNQKTLLDDITDKLVELTNLYFEEDAIFDKNKVVQKTVKEVTKILKQRIRKTPIVIVKILNKDEKKK